MNKLLPLQTRVYHDGHGLGTIVAYNTTRCEYLEQHLDEELVAEAVRAGLIDAVVDSFYGSDRYPYVVKFDKSGYQDVYGVDGQVMKVVA